LKEPLRGVSSQIVNIDWFSFEILIRRVDQSLFSVFELYGFPFNDALDSFPIFDKVLFVL
jgi:hypothetical protein